MKREIYSRLLEWKNSHMRKPLMLYGARQVGKTYILTEFGKNEFDEMIHINCYHNPIIENIFSGDADTKRILMELSVFTGKNIDSSVFLFFDEVQEVPEVVASLKYFCENAPDIFVAAAGSLLGVMNMGETSFPTGKVEILHMYPMTFLEFLSATGNDSIATLLYQGSEFKSIDNFSPSLINLLRQYYYVGGMPEAVKVYVETGDVERVRKIQIDIIESYESDIAKHAGKDAIKARKILQSIPSQLAKENKKFKFAALRKGARANEYENAIQWLVDAGMIYKVCRVSKPSIPLSFYIDESIFKLYFLDIGLLGALAGVPPSLILITNDIFTEYKGAFTENYVLTQLIIDPNIKIGYFSKDNSTLEIDFLIQLKEKIIPIEVKSEFNVRSKSLRQFVTIDYVDRAMKGIRFSMRGYDNQDWVINIPLYAVIPEVLSKSL